MSNNVLRNIACKNFYKCEQYISENYSNETNGYCVMCAFSMMINPMTLDQRAEIKAILNQKQSYRAF